MATIKLDDLGKKKDAPQVLDLSRTVVQTKEEFRKLLDRVPEYKIRPEKVRSEELKAREKDFTFTASKREGRRQGEYSYANPIPPDMRSVKLEDLSPVPIDWKMLTSIRPKLKMEEEMFSRDIRSLQCYRMVLMGKLHLKTAARDKRSTDSTPIRKHKNRAGILETRATSCKECGEEFCTGVSCTSFLYECFYRTNKLATKILNEDLNAAAEKELTKTGKKKKKKQKTKRSKSRKKRKKGKKKDSKKDAEGGEKKLGTTAQK